MFLNICGSGIVYTVDDATGGLRTSHRMELSCRDYAGNPGPVGELLLIVVVVLFTLWM